MRIFLSLILCAIFLFSCESNEIVIESDNLLVGHWISPTHNGDETTFTRGNSLPKEGYGITFTQNGDIVQRTSGFCGTPPLSFFTIQGTFQLENTLIKITTNSYPNNYAWRIVSLTENKLVVKKELTEQELDHRKLMDIYDEILNLAYAESCHDKTDWTFTAFGSKACGGPQGYIPYSKKIDTLAFLEKVQEYTNAEKEFNIKWAVISDCAIVNPPKNIACKNGFPNLNY